MDEPKVWRYDGVSRLLHWTIGMLLIGLIALGWYMMSIALQPVSRWYFNLHKSLGIVAGVLIFFRLIWRWCHKPVPLPLSVPYWQAATARTIHWLLYGCMILMPVTGFMGASFGQYGISFFGLKLPAWLPQNPTVSAQLFELHGIIAWSLVVLIVLHVLAAFKHLLINKDQVFQRMWI